MILNRLKLRYVETPNYVLISESRPAERTEGRNTHPLSARTLIDGPARHQTRSYVLLCVFFFFRTQPEIELH